MAEMLQKWTRMPVQQAEDAQRAERNHVYVIPPARYLTAIDGHFRLSPLETERGRRVAVDLFFRSLADTHGPNAAAVVLSGADGDGSLGIKRIKERGGLTIVQDPEEAEHDGMPRAAIASGMVDWVLPAAQMPRRILNYIQHAWRLQLPPEEGPQPAKTAPPPAAEPEAALREILVSLRTRTGRDLTYYKRATILRRIARRMQVNAIEDLGAYLTFLRTHQGECGALLKDLLISVTNFFRDRDSFIALEQHIPELFSGKRQSEPVRVWCPACATGEEAYSIAMLLIEHAHTLDAPPPIQVFGCDLDEDAIRVARAGFYPEAIAADVSEDRLRRFFIKEPTGYRVRREVRELVLFAPHDLLKDAPFSRLDLISCRNLLIYLNRDAQGRVLDLFHFALRAPGLLLLGSSESVEDGNRLFDVIDKKHRIYRRTPMSRTALPLPTGPSTLFVRQLEQQMQQTEAKIESAKHPVVVPPATFSQSAEVAFKTLSRPSHPDDRASWAELHYKLIERFSPPSLIIDREHEIQHLSDSAGQFLQLGGGQPSTNLMRLVNPEWRAELRALLFRAAQSGEMAVARGLDHASPEGTRKLDIRIAPAGDLAAGYLLVSFELQAPEPADAPEATGEARSSPGSIVQHLERELEHLKGHLRDTVEQYEASTEELKASNEELQAMNEELRSATEELETSREELQSINEELTTLNQESKSKLDELAHANSDLQNLMGATAIPTVFLDRELRVMLFTQSAAPIFNLIPGDIGRPLSDLQHRIDYPDLEADAGRVLSSLQPAEREVNGNEGGCHLVRVLPYLTVDDRIGGVVLTFVDITERQRDATELRKQIEQLERFSQAAIGRELRMVELKREINELAARLGEPPRYSLDFERPEDDGPGP
jgi:two-component system CheB/CheR fusion protein